MLPRVKQDHCRDGSINRLLRVIGHPRPKSAHPTRPLARSAASFIWLAGSATRTLFLLIDPFYMNRGPLDPTLIGVLYGLIYPAINNALMK